MRFLSFLFSAQSIAIGPKGNWPKDAAVDIRPAPPKGDGVFSKQSITPGTFVCRYQGVVLTVEEEEKLYPDRYPDYCLQISPNLSIDGQNSNHWSRFINHNENGNLKIHTDAEQRTAYFTATTDIAPGDELCFDYGVAYFVFRGITPAPATESRSLELPTESMAEALAQAPPSTPRSRSEIRAVMDGNEPMDVKKAAFVRGLDFYGGVRWMDDGETVELPTCLADKKTCVFNFSEVSVDELAELLENLWDESQLLENN